MDPQVLISLGALMISTGAFFFSKRSFLEANRPIVTAEIVTHDAGNVATLFSIFVHNVGNRPACEIRLQAKKGNIDKIVSKEANERLLKEIYMCFSTGGVIPILHSGKSAKNSFGASSSIKEQNSIVYQSVLPVQIEYKDLNGQKYKSKLSLIVKDSESFAGSFWSEKE